MIVSKPSLRLSVGVLGIVTALIVAPAADAAKPRVFGDCKAMDKVYPHGVAKNFKVIKKANGLTGRPFVSSSIYNANPKRDRDKDGVACET